MMMVRGTGDVVAWRRACAPSASGSYLRPETSIAASSCLGPWVQRSGMAFGSVEAQWRGAACSVLHGPRAERLGPHRVRRTSRELGRRVCVVAAFGSLRLCVRLRSG